MRIILTSGIFPPDIGGPASYVPRLAAELASLGHQVQVICLSDSLDHPDDRYPFRVHRILRGKPLPMRYLATLRRILAACRESDLVYVNGLSFEAALAARWAGIPAVHKIVGDYAWERAQNRGWFRGTLDEFQAARKGPLLAMGTWIRTTPLRSAAHIIVPSAYLAGIVRGWGIEPARVSVVFNACEAPGSLPAPALPPFPGKTLVTICRLVPWKGLSEIIAIVAADPSLRLVVIGDGPLRASLASLAVESGAVDRVYLLGSVEKGRIPAYLAQSDLFVLNSTYEGLPHVVLEAMAAGVPVVATNAGGTGEVVRDGETGLLIPCGDRRALGEAIGLVLTDPVLARRLAAQAKEMLAREFAEASMYRETLRILEASGRNVVPVRPGKDLEHAGMPSSGKRR